MSLPDNLAFYFSTMNQSRQRWKINVDSRQTAVLGDTLVFSLPAAQVALDTISLNFDFKLDTSGTNAALSSGVESLIDSVQVESQGVIIDQSFSGWNRLALLLKDFQTGDVDKTRAILANDLASAPAAKPFSTATPLSVPKFTHGFLGTCMPRIIDFSLFPVKVYVKLAGKECLMTEDASKITTNDLTNINLCLDTIQLNDGNMYAAKILERLQQAPIQIPFERWVSFNEGARDVTSTMNVGISTTSLRGLLGVFRDPLGCASATWSASNSSLLRSNYFVNSLGTNNALTSSQFQIQNVNFPNWPQSKAEVFDTTVKHMNIQNLSKGVTTLDTYFELSAAHYFDVGFPGVTSKDRIRSGISLAGTTGQISWATTGTTGGTQPQKVLYARTEPYIEVGLGRQIQLVV
jgi:hypothetical protein